MTRSALRFAFLIGIFAAGIGIGCLCWRHITLPFSNPWRVAGLLPSQQFNPANNTLRCYCVIFAPSALLLWICLVLPGARRLVTEVPRRPEHPTSDKDRTRRRPIWPVICLFALSLVAGLNAYTDTACGPFDPVHEGESLGPAVCWSHGLVPYRDFVLVHGIFQDPGRSLIGFALFGRSIAAVRSFGSIVKLLTFILIALVALLACEMEPLPAFVFVGCYGILHTLPMVWQGTWVGNLLHTTGRYSAVFLFLAVLLAMHRAISTGTRVTMWTLFGAFALGFVPLASLSMSTDVGGQLTLCTLILIPSLYVAFELSRTQRIRLTLLSLAGAGVGVLLLARLVGYDMAAYAKAEYVLAKTFQLSTGLYYPVRQWPWLVALVIVGANVWWLAVKLLAEPYPPGSTSRLAIGQFVRRYYPELAMCVVSLALFGSAVVRSDWVHVCIGLGPALLVTLTIILRHLALPWVRTGASRKIASIAVAVAVVSLAWAGVQRIWDMDKIRENFPLDIPDSAFIPESHQSAVEFLRKHLGPKDNFYVLTSQGAWFYYLDKPCPCRFPLVLYATTDFYQRELVNDLDKANVKLILCYNADWSNYIDGISTGDRVPIVAGYVRTHYHPLRTVAGHAIWARNQQPADSPFYASALTTP